MSSMTWPQKSLCRTVFAFTFSPFCSLSFLIKWDLERNRISLFPCTARESVSDWLTNWWEGMESWRQREITREDTHDCYSHTRGSFRVELLFYFVPCYSRNNAFLFPLFTEIESLSLFPSFPSPFFFVFALQNSSEPSTEKSNFSFWFSRRITRHTPFIPWSSGRECTHRQSSESYFLSLMCPFCWTLRVRSLPIPVGTLRDIRTSKT